MTEFLTRFGYVTKGLVYTILGLLALQVAFGDSAQTDTTGVLKVIAAQPFGKLLLMIITVGLVGYVFWRCLQAVFDPEHPTQESRRIFQRLGYAASGLSYAGLAIAAVRLILNLKEQNGDRQSPQDWTALLLSQPFGQWLVGLVGIAIIGIGISYLYRSRFQQFDKHFDIVQEEYLGVKWAMQVGRFGIAARGCVFCLIGLFVIQAALKYDPKEARGLDGALRALADGPFGKLSLGLVAFGFIAYGVHLFVEARYRRLAALQDSSRKESHS